MSHCVCWRDHCSQIIDWCFVKKKNLLSKLGNNAAMKVLELLVAWYQYVAYPQSVRSPYSDHPPERFIICVRCSAVINPF